MSELTLTKPEDIESTAEAFKAWLTGSEAAIKNVISTSTNQLNEIGTAIKKVRRLWTELRNEI